MQSGDLVHVVLISFRDSARAEDRDWALAEYRSLGAVCGGAEAGIRYWQVGPNQDQRKNWRLVQFSIFEDEAALQKFRRHPAHAAASERLRHFADWAVGDITLL